jgi:rhamnosyl/mannosyltransferase
MFLRPTVACEIGSGTTFVNVHGETDLVVPRQNPGALVEATNTLLHDREAAAIYGR